ncbi:MAG: hypothetical protein JSS81_20690 [Acidobacteria bacterium]|nr:hypothetical protein [Acidobacteriota bacterium]
MAYKISPEVEEILKELVKDAGGDGFERIRCPLCRWQPTAESRWCCASSGEPENFDGGCYTVWNTFETRGRCPGCNHQWRWTICPRCHGWSLHNDWYEKNAS